MDADLPPPKSSFLALYALGLSGAQLAALAQRGALCAEDRGRGRVYWQLRFRIGTKQHTRYIGNNEGFVAQVRRELTQLQVKARSRMQLRRLARESRRELRRTKRLLEPLLSSAGLIFHGRAIRRPRVGHDEGSVDVDGNPLIRRKIMQNDHECKEVNAAPAATPHGATTATVVPRQAAADRRAKRIEEFMRNSLQEPDAFQATIRAATADLMDIGYRLAAAVKAAGDNATIGSAEYEDVSPAINNLLLVNRQITRFAHLDLQWTRANGANKAGKKSQRRRPTAYSEETKT
jgi:hypothetical protein